jgi:hypothetical protein
MESETMSAGSLTTADRAVLRFNCRDQGEAEPFLQFAIPPFEG